MSYAINIQDSYQSKCIRDESLDFKGIPAGEGVHSIHSYPAMFHPRLVRKFIGLYSKSSDTVMDPFLGSGVSSVESAVSGRRFCGFDINPLAVLIAKTRSTPLQRDILKKALSLVLNEYKKLDPGIHSFPNIQFWFTQDRIEGVSKILQAVHLIEDEKVQSFFKIALSETIKTVSLSKPDEFKLVRRKKPCVAPTILVFEKNALQNIDALCKFYRDNAIRHEPKLELKDILREPIEIKDNSVSLLITSPPYGDSQTTVAYGQFSRLPLQWLNLPYSRDKYSLGAKAVAIENKLPSVVLYEDLMRIGIVDTKRAEHVYSFYRDLFRCMKKLILKIKMGGYVVFVVGNRTVKGVQLQTDAICAELLQSLGCEHLETRIRQIGNKRMPAENSPTNIVGKKSPTMKYEYVVICKRTQIQVG